MLSLHSLAEQTSPPTFEPPGVAVIYAAVAMPAFRVALAYVSHHPHLCEGPSRSGKNSMVVVLARSALMAQDLLTSACVEDGEWNRIFNISVAQCGDVLWSQRRDLPILL